MKVLRKVTDIILVIALIVTSVNISFAPKTVGADEVEPISNLKIYNYCNRTGKYFIYFTEPKQADGYQIFVDDETEPVADIEGSGEYITNDELNGVSAGEHNLRVATYVTVEGIKYLSDKKSAKITKSDQVGEATDIPQVYIRTSGGITSDYFADSDVNITVVDQDGGSKGLGYVDDEGSHPDGSSIKKYDNVIDTESNIKVRGNTTAGQPKKAWNFKLSGKTSLLGMPKGKKWCLLANAMDKSLMRDTLSYNFGLENGVKYTSQSRYVDVYLNGEFRGNYQLCEPVEAKSNRVEVEAYDAENNDILLEVGTRNEQGVDHFTTDVLGQTFDVNDPEKGDDLSDDQVDAKIARVKSFLNGFEQVLKNNRNDLYAVSEYMDIDSFVDYYIANELFKNVDFNFSSTRFYIKDNKIYAGPMWDLDLSSGNCKSSYYRDYYVNGDSAQGYYCRRLKWYTELFRNSEFNELVKDRFYALQYRIQNIYRNDSTAVNSINYLVNRYGTSFARNYADQSQLGAGWPIIYDDGFSYAAESGWQTWMDPINFLGDWLARRNTWMCNQWNIDETQAYADSKDWEENPTTAGPTTVRPTTTERPTREHQSQDYYDAWINTNRNLSLSGTASDTGTHREGEVKYLNDGIINVWENRDGITVDDGNNYSGTFDIALDKDYDASTIDQVVVYWRTADKQFYPEDGYKVQFGYKGKFTTVDTVIKSDYPTEGTKGGWGNDSRFVTESDFTKDRLPSGGVDTVRILVDTPVEWGAQVRELCVFAENPGKYPPDPTTATTTTLAPTTKAPTVKPTDPLTDVPTQTTTDEPTIAPTEAPTGETPVEPTVAPTNESSNDQTVSPTDKKPTVKPSGGTSYSNTPGRATVVKAKKSAKKIKVTLKRMSRVSGYQIAVYKSKKNAKKNKKAIVKKHTITLKTKIKSKKFAKRKKLYVRARAYAIVKGKVYYGRWSAIKKVKK